MLLLAGHASLRLAEWAWSEGMGEGMHQPGSWGTAGRIKGEMLGGSRECWGIWSRGLTQR